MRKNKLRGIFKGKEIWSFLAWAYFIILLVTILNIKSNIETTPKIETYRAGYFYSDCVFTRWDEERNEIKTDVCELQNKTDEIIERINDKSNLNINLLVLALSFLGFVSSYMQYKQRKN